MKITLKVDTNTVGKLELFGEIETLADVRKFARKLEAWITGILRVLPQSKEAKVTGLVLGKE